MDPQTIGWVGMGVMLLLLVLRVPVAFALASVGFVGYIVISGIGPALKVAGLVPYSAVATYGFSVVPLFIIMGHFAHHAGFVRDIFRTGQLWLGRIPGGLCHATIAAGAAMGAASGSGFASTALLSQIAVPEMRKTGVDKRLAVGTVATVGPIAQMIPPSILMVLYGIITETSIGKLLIAGVFPGLTMALSYMLMVYLRAKRTPSLAPPLTEHVTWRQRFSSLKGIWGIALLAILVIGGLYTGVFTPTEAGAVGAFGAFAMSLALRRLGWAELRGSLIDTARITGMVFLIVACAFMFGYFLSVTRIPFMVSEFLTTLTVAPIVVLIMVMLMYLVLGLFIDMVAAMFITLPIIFPAIVSFGYDPIWFGVLIVLQCEIALITPPFGISLFIVRGIVKDVEMGDIIRGVVPFFVVDIALLALFIAFPQIALFLPQRMMGG